MMSHSSLTLNDCYSPKNRIDFVVTVDELFIIIVVLLSKPQNNGVNTPHACFYVIFPTAHELFLKPQTFVFFVFASYFYE